MHYLLERNIIWEIIWEIPLRKIIHVLKNHIWETGYFVNIIKWKISVLPISSRIKVDHQQLCNVLSTVIKCTVIKNTVIKCTVTIFWSLQAVHWKASMKVSFREGIKGPFISVSQWTISEELQMRKVKDIAIYWWLQLHFYQILVSYQIFWFSLFFGSKWSRVQFIGGRKVQCVLGYLATAIASIRGRAS